MTGVSLDSRACLPGDLYVALPGSRAHGAVFAPEAGRRGAVAVLTDEVGRHRLQEQGCTLPTVVVEQPRLAMAGVAAQVYGDPSSSMQMFGITGTNGKTTTAFLVDGGLRACGVRVGTIGTLGFQVEGQPLDTTRTTVTTPESVDLQALLAVYLERGAQACVMEVSSHALALHRVAGTQFDVVGFTNLGQDHLDFHRDLDDYFETKASLFVPGWAARAVVMVTDPWGRALAERIRVAGAPQLTTVGDDPGCDVVIVEHHPTSDGGSHVVLELTGQRISFDLDLPGEHNVRNAALALTMLDTAGLDVQVAVAGLAHAQVPGRMQRVGIPGGPTVVVDFAHTPQAIQEAVRMASAFARTAAVLGAGGDRDRAKRAAMGQAAASVDLLVVTDDNPRGEDPAAIRAEVARGSALGSAEVRVVGDRREAIREALAWARADDLVLVLGKGHERGQQVGDHVIPFDDADVVSQVWQEVSGASS